MAVLQDADAPVIGIASLPMPHIHQVAIAAVDSQGYVHIYCTPLAAENSAVQQGLSGTALGVARTGSEGTLPTALAETGDSRHAAAAEAVLDQSNSSSGLSHLYGSAQLMMATIRSANTAVTCK